MKQHIKIDFEVLLHRMFGCWWGRHKWQMKVDYYLKECYWCGELDNIHGGTLTIKKISELFKKTKER